MLLDYSDRPLFGGNSMTVNPDCAFHHCDATYCQRLKKLKNYWHNLRMCGLSVGLVVIIFKKITIDWDLHSSEIYVCLH